MTSAAAPVRTIAAPVRKPSVTEVAALRESTPRMRGISHEKALAFAPALGLLLVATADGPRASAAAAVFAATGTLMLGVSVLNHRTPVTPGWQPWLRRLDHATVNLFLAGTWTAIALVVLSGTTKVAVTGLVWGGAIAATLVTALRVDVPGWIPASIVLAAGWSATFALPEIAAAVGPDGIALLLLGGAFYTAGAVVYGLRRPSPLPAMIGYHEIFHALVLLGAGCHYLALAFFVFPHSS